MDVVRKSIWLVNYYAMPPHLESRLRTIKFANFLTKMGYDVTIFGSSFMHNKNINLISDNSRFIEKEYDGLKFVHIKSVSYKDNSWLRFYSLFQFHFRLLFLRKRFNKPDVIVHTALPPFGNIIYYCAKSLRARYIVEVLDLWPESFVAFGLVKKTNPLVMFAYYLEKWLYKKSDEVVFSMEGGKDYIIDKKWDIGNGGPINLERVHYINNGVDIRDFDTYKEKYKLDDPDLEDTQFFKVIYLGSIRLANNLQRLIDAASLLLNEKRIKVFIYGDGGDRPFLEEYCIKNGISNVIFKERWIEPQFVPYVVSKSSLNILNYMPNAIFKYGGSQSKLFQYLAGGKPICSNLKMGYCLISNNKLGIAQHFNTNEEYAAAIKSIAELDSLTYYEMCERSRKIAEEYDYEVLTERFSHLL